MGRWEVPQRNYQSLSDCVVGHNSCIDAVVQAIDQNISADMAQYQMENTKNFDHCLQCCPRSENSFSCCCQTAVSIWPSVAVANFKVNGGQIQLIPSTFLTTGTSRLCEF